MPTPRLVLLMLHMLAVLALVGGMSAAAVAQDGRRSTLLLIDGSGSMWGRFETQDEKRAKIDIVRDLVRPVIAGNTTGRIGLQSFGHRRRGDCSDVEVIAPPSLERPNLLFALDKLNPRGKAPLAEGLRQAAQAIGATRPASVIVIGDGIDNCRQDACAAAAEFAKTAPGVPVHVIGMGVAPAERPDLQCITSATAGKFFDARDPVALTAAISEATALALGPEASETADQNKSSDAASRKNAETAAAALPSAGVVATLALTRGGKPLDLQATWRIAKGNNGELIKTVTAAQLAETLAPGTYTITAELDGLSASSPVEIDEGPPETVSLSLDAGRLKVSAPELKGTEPLIVVRQAGAPSSSGTVVMRSTARVDTALPPAAYTVALIAGDYRQEKAVTVTAGEETAAAFQNGLGTLSLTAVLQEGGQPVTGTTFSILEDDPDSPGGRRETRRSRASDPRFTLPPGTYYINVSAGFAETRERVALSAGDTISKAIVLPAAAVKLSTTIAGTPPGADNAPVLHIERIDGAPIEIARMSTGAFEGLLGAGRYRLTALLDKHAASASTEITVQAGKPLVHVLDIEAAEVALSSPLQTAGGAFWEVRDAAGKAVWHATTAQPRVLLAPGRYSVRLDTKDSEFEAAFTVETGQPKSIELGPN